MKVALIVESGALCFDWFAWFCVQFDLKLLDQEDISLESGIRLQKVSMHVVCVAVISVAFKETIHV